MSYEFSLPSRPFSINASYYRDARIKTSEVKEWSAQIFHRLNTVENIEKMRQIRESFDDQRHSISIEIVAIYPRSEFITKSGILSSRTIDVTNFEKLLVDLFFAEQYFDKPSPYGVRNICLNDKHIVHMVSSKKFHEKDSHELQFSVSIIPRAF